MKSNKTVNVCAGEFFKTIPVLISVFALAVSGIACGGSDKDEDEEELEANTMKDRSGNKYKTVVIGSQTWMAENMKYMGVDIQCRGRSVDLEYGCLYNWDDAKKVCPDGWHLPTKKDFDDLLAYADAHRTSASVFLSLIAKSDDWKDYPSQGGDDFGFAALPTEQAFSDGSFSGSAGFAAYFWSSEEHIDADGIDNGWRLRVNGVLTEVELMNKDVGDSVRCLKD